MSLPLNAFGLDLFTLSLLKRCVGLRQAQPERVFVVQAGRLAWRLHNDGGHSKNKSNNNPMEVRL